MPETNALAYFIAFSSDDEKKSFITFLPEVPQSVKQPVVGPVDAVEGGVVGVHAPPAPEARPQRQQDRLEVGPLPHLDHAQPGRTPPGEKLNKHFLSLLIL